MICAILLWQSTISLSVQLFNNWYLYKVHWEKVGSNPRATLHQSKKSTIKLNISYFVYLTCVPPVPTGFENCIFGELTIFIRDSSKLILTHLTGGNFITLWSILDINHKLSKLYRGGHWGVPNNAIP